MALAKADVRLYSASLREIKAIVDRVDGAINILMGKKLKYERQVIGIQEKLS